jgi:hypothetical protein
MPNCSCNIVGLLNINYSGIISASVNGGTTIEISEDGTVLLGATINNLSISAYPFEPGGDYYLGATCNSSAQVQLGWVQKYDCFNDVMHFIPKTGGKASITGSSLNGVTLTCDPNIESDSFDASSNSGPATPYITNVRKDGYNLVYTGLPISISSGSPEPYNINLGSYGNITAYLQSFSIQVSPPQPAVVQYSFVFAG